MKIIYEEEVRRIRFILKRDGMDEAIAFAKQGIISYRKGVLATRKKYGNKSSHLSIDPYKKYAIESYLQYRDFLKTPYDYV